MSAPKILLVDDEFRLKDLRLGMVLARELRTADGILLLAKNAELQEKQLERVRAFHETHPFADIIHVYRKKASQ